MQNSLHLVGDGDDVDVVVDVEATFNIEISDSEADATYTVGALYDLIEMKCGGEPTQVCHTQRAFYRLRRALTEMGADRPIAPETKIDVVVATRPRALARSWYELSRRSGLQLPPLETPSFGVGLVSGLTSPAIGILFTIVAFAASVSWNLGYHRGSAWLIALVVMACFLACWHVIYSATRHIPQRLRALGDLAKEAAGHSYPSLNDHRTCSADDRWQALVAILRDISGHKGPITRETTFIAG